MRRGVDDPLRALFETFRDVMMAKVEQDREQLLGPALAQRERAERGLRVAFALLGYRARSGKAD